MAPQPVKPQIRDLSFYLIGSDGWVDLKRTRRYRLSTPGPYLPALTVTHHGDDYQLVLDILPDPLRDVLLIRYALDGPYRLATILAGPDPNPNANRLLIPELQPQGAPLPPSSPLPPPPPLVPPLPPWILVP